MKVPFSQDGQRDYRAPIQGVRNWPPADDSVSKWYRLALFLAIVALIAVLSFSLLGCALWYPPSGGRYTPEPIHPSLERVRELAQVDAGNRLQSPATAGWLRLSSPFVLAGNGVRLTCLVPEHRDHRYLRLALIDAVGPIRSITHATQTDSLLIESVPCGQYEASCDSLANSARVLAHYEQPLTSRGSCNAGGDDR